MRRFGPHSSLRVLLDHAMSSMPGEGLDLPDSPAVLPSDDEGISVANLMGVQARATGLSVTKREKLLSF